MISRPVTVYEDVRVQPGIQESGTVVFVGHSESWGLESKFYDEFVTYTTIDSMGKVEKCF